MGRSNAENSYLTWLVKRMNVVDGKNYGMLLREMYRIEFYSVVKYDEDRGSDGIVLRETWADEVGYRGNVSFGPPRVLEALVGISLRIEDQIFGGPWADEWDYKNIFWNLIDNLGLIEYDGVLNSIDYDKVVTILDRFLARTYQCDTFGNIFRFSVIPDKMRKMNLWSQMQLYIAEKWPGNSYF